MEEKRFDGATYPIALVLIRGKIETKTEVADKNFLCPFKAKKTHHFM